jgi:hypothetical protein
MSASPRLFQPCARVILVFAHVSPMKTRRLGSSRQLGFLPQGAAPRDVRADLLAGEKRFFEADPLAARKPPQSVAGHGDAALAQFGKNRMQRQIRFFGKAAEKKAPLAVQEIRPLAAHRLRRRTAPHAGAPRPFHNARHAHRKGSGHRPASFATRNHGHNAFTQIARMSSRHPCWPPASSTEFESDYSRFKNPQRFKPVAGIVPAIGAFPSRVQQAAVLIKPEGPDAHLKIPRHFPDRR